MFWLIISEFDRLTSISVQASDDASIPSQLQSLLNRASHLYTLKLHSWQSIPYMLLAEITSKSTRRLDLRSNHLYFNEETCAKLSSTSLGIQCKVLLVHMKNLRALYVHCKDSVHESNDFFFLNPLSPANGLIKWLQERLPTTFAISSDDYFTTCIRLWIRY